MDSQTIEQYERYKQYEKLSLKIEQLVRLKYEEEVKREESLLAQSSNMQTVFSISSAAMFMLLPTIVDARYRGSLSLNLIFIFVSIITFFLLLSLLHATFAQHRMERVMPATIQSLKDEIEDKSKLKKNLEEPVNLTRELIKAYTEAHGSLRKNNDKRVRLIQISMYLFYVALGTCALFFVISSIILLTQ